MRAIFLLTVAVTLATPWGLAVDGLSTRVSTLETDPATDLAIGKPLKVQLEVKNTGTEPKSFDDQQAAVNGSMLVKGPDGKDVPHIGGSYQTMGAETTLAPGATKLVVKELDVAEQYLIDKPGNYTLQFRARGGLPASNELAVTLKAGELADFVKLLASIYHAAPAAWRATRYGDSIVLLNLPTNLKADASSVSLYFTKDDKRPALGPKTQPIDLGSTKLGHAWLVPDSNAAERWPAHIKFFQDQLKPFAKAN